ncbi:MAG TPA: Gfo/Idh/MocA family oxidoreductase, partial [Kineosporiaceae bacterium]|nr:Gfo/Idh/MocA family oxidoreductase [Kineosporiaceae bacterium]
AVGSRDLDRGREFAERHGIARVHGSYEELLADDDVEAVYISLPNGQHHEWTLRALAAGKHVLCEKPLGLDPAAVATMTAAAAEHDRLLVEAFWYRWHPRTRRLEQLLTQGALGPVRHVESDFTFSGGGAGDPQQQFRLNPQRGGGGLYDVGCYALSAAHLALGPDLEVVSATARRGPSGVDLEAWATLRVVDQDGVDRGDPDRPAAGTARIRCGIDAADRQAIIVTGAAAEVEFGTPAFGAIHTTAELTIRTPDGAVRQEQFAPVDPYRLMIEAVAGRIRGEQTFLPGPAHSQQVAATTAAIFATLD